MLYSIYQETVSISYPKYNHRFPDSPINLINKEHFPRNRSSYILEMRNLTVIVTSAIVCIVKGQLELLQLITQQSIQILLNIRVSELIVPFTVDARSWTANLPVALTFILSLILGAVATEDCEFVRKGTMETKTVNLAGRIFSGSTTVVDSETKVTSQLRLYTSYLYCFHMGLDNW